MGLGKTIEILSCMVSNLRSGPQRNLIVCPVSISFLLANF